MTEINIKQIKNQFEIDTGIHKNNIEEISDAFPYSKIACILTMDKTFYFMLTNFGKAKKKSFLEEK